jgi:hypothetical protein
MLEPLKRPKPDQINEGDKERQDRINQPHVTIYGVGCQSGRDFVVLHGVDVETQQEYWIKVSKDDISELNQAIINNTCDC